MVKPNIIVSWPDNCDYPLWRLFIHESRNLFDKVIVVFTKTNTNINFKSFVFSQLLKDNIIMIDSPIINSGEDWRDIAVKSGLKYIIDGWIWFTEQDFEVKPGFFDYINNSQIDGINVIAAYQGTRMHPCSIFITRSLLSALNTDYGIIPNKGDHFCKLQSEIELHGIPVRVIPEYYYKHYNGLSHNWRLVSDGQKAVYKPDEFNEYLMACLDAPVDLDDKFKELAEKAINAYNADKKKCE